MDAWNSPQSLKELRVGRWLILIGAFVYLAWWFGVELLLPKSFNPLASRLVVVGILFAIYGASFYSEAVRFNIRKAFIASAWLITLHFYYLFYMNGGNLDWVIGAYITVSAITLLLMSSGALLSYSIFVTLLSVLMVIAIPELRYSVFLPGLITILIQANVGLQSRFGLIRTLADSNDRFQLLFNSTFEGVMVHENGRILDVNDAFAQLTGYSRHELEGKNALTFVHPDWRASAAEKMKFAEVPPYETVGINREGKVVDLEVRAKSFTFDNVSARLVTIRDITDRKRAEEERIAALTMAENVRVRDEFISLASHELKTPITSMKIQTQLMERGLKNGSPEVIAPKKLSEFVAVLGRQVNRLNELVETMLDVSRISTGRLVLDVRDVDLSQLVREVVQSSQAQLTRANPQLNSAIQVDVPSELIVRADPSRIKQVIENLIGNAIKYGQESPIEVRVSAEAARVSIVVVDRGMGIPPEFLGKIFERFERAVSPSNISGLGLGLFIVRQIVEAHQGAISVESEPGKGSSFKVSLPVSEFSI